MFNKTTHTGLSAVHTHCRLRLGSAPEVGMEMCEIIEILDGSAVAETSPKEGKGIAHITEFEGNVYGLICVH